MEANTWIIVKASVSFPMGMAIRLAWTHTEDSSARRRITALAISPTNISRDAYSWQTLIELLTAP